MGKKPTRTFGTSILHRSEQIVKHLKKILNENEKNQNSNIRKVSWRKSRDVTDKKKEKDQVNNKTNHSKYPKKKKRYCIYKIQTGLMGEGTVSEILKKKRSPWK